MGCPEASRIGIQGWEKALCRNPLGNALQGLVEEGVGRNAFPGHLCCQDLNLLEERRRESFPRPCSGVLLGPGRTSAESKKCQGPNNH